MNHPHRKLTFVGALVLTTTGLVVAACGNDDDLKTATAGERALPTIPGVSQTSEPTTTSSTTTVPQGGGRSYDSLTGWLTSDDVDALRARPLPVELLLPTYIPDWVADANPVIDVGLEAYNVLWPSSSQNATNLFIIGADVSHRSDYPDVFYDGAVPIEGTKRTYWTAEGAADALCSGQPEDVGGAGLRWLDEEQGRVYGVSVYNTPGCRSDITLADLVAMLDSMVPYNPDDYGG